MHTKEVGSASSSSYVATHRSSTGAALAAAVMLPRSTHAPCKCREPAAVAASKQQWTCQPTPWWTADCLHGSTNAARARLQNATGVSTLPRQTHCLYACRAESLPLSAAVPSCRGNGCQSNPGIAARCFPPRFRAGYRASKYRGIANNTIDVSSLFTCGGCYGVV
jgi:hypothetical protein